MNGAHSIVARRAGLALLAAATICSCREDPPPRAKDPPAPTPSFTKTSTTSSKRSVSGKVWNSIVRNLRVHRVEEAGGLSKATAPLSALLPERRPLAIQIFATYCPPCIEEMPMFDGLFGEGYGVVGLSMDSGDEDALLDLLAKERIRYSVLLLTDDSMKDAGGALEAGLPTTVILGPDGSATELLVGKASRAEVVAALSRASALP